MADAVIVPLWSALFTTAAIWLGLVFWVFRRLRVRHPATYEAIGSPSLFWNNSMRNNWLFLKFLFGTTWQHLGDRSLAVALRIMQVILVVYVAGFALWVVLIWTLS